MAIMHNKLIKDKNMIYWFDLWLNVSPTAKVIHRYDLNFKGLIRQTRSSGFKLQALGYKADSEWLRKEIFVSCSVQLMLKFVLLINVKMHFNIYE